MCGRMCGVAVVPAAALCWALSWTAGRPCCFTLLPHTFSTLSPNIPLLFSQPEENFYVCKWGADPESVVPLLLHTTCTTLYPHSSPTFPLLFLQPEENFYVCKWGADPESGAPLLLLAGQNGVVRVVDCSRNTLLHVSEGGRSAQGTLPFYG